jgi:hypothetical protein
VWQPGPAAKALSLSRRHTVGPLGAHQMLPPVPLGRRWCGCSAGVPIPQALQSKTAILLTTVFTCRASGEDGRNQVHGMPPRAREAIRRDRIGGASSRRNSNLLSGVISLVPAERGSDPARPNRRRTVQVESKLRSNRFPRRELIKCARADDLRKSASPRKRPSVTEPQHVVMGRRKTSSENEKARYGGLFILSSRLNR